MSDRYTGSFDRRMVYALCTVDGGVYVVDSPYQDLGGFLDTIDKAIEYLGKLPNILFSHGSRNGKPHKARLGNWTERNPKHTGPNSKHGRKSSYSETIALFCNRM